MSYPKLIENVIEHLNKLPGIGRRSAERMVFWMLNHSLDEVRGLSDSMTRLKEGLRVCRRCNNLSEEESCRVCRDVMRNRKMICVVETPKDVLAIERSGAFKGVYHVLLGAISPAEGRGPDDLKIQHLLNRIEVECPEEIIIATDADNEGEMTALYLAKKLKPLDLKVTRIGLGLPVGSSVEFSDMSTLGMSLMSRREV
ncbi:recombination mediator RecR [Candidatus Omnitrophota bacterium]